MTTTTPTHLQDIGAKHVTKGLGRITGDAVMVRGRGSWAEFEDGRRLLDFTTGIGVTNLGHCHPKVSQAAADQCSNLVHAQVPSHDVSYCFTKLTFPFASPSAASRTMNLTSGLSRNCSPLCQILRSTRFSFGTLDPKPSRAH